MRAVVIDKFGDADVLQIREVDTPAPHDNEVLIKVSHAGVNPVDYKIRNGLLDGRLPHAFPLIPGWDVAGVVEKVGKNVTTLAVGDEVYAYVRKPVIQWGTYCEYVTFPETGVAKKPKSLTMAQSAATPLAALTAWQSLFVKGHFEKGQSIFIHAGAGGVGSFALQFAKWKGAKEIVTTASSHNHGYVESLGATTALDYKKDTYKGKVDFLYDTMGGDILINSLPFVKEGGEVVSLLVPKAPLEADGLKYSYVFVEPNREQLEEIATLYDAGALVPPQIEEFPLSQAKEVQQLVEEGHTRGKLVLTLN